MPPLITDNAFCIDITFVADILINVEPVYIAPTGKSTKLYPLAPALTCNILLAVNEDKPVPP